MKTVSLIGPMTGHPDFNHQSFREAEKLLQDRFAVISPANINMSAEFREKAKDRTSKEYATLLGVGIFHAITSDIVIALPWWWDSPGANKEARCALEHGAGRVESIYNYIKETT